MAQKKDPDKADETHAATFNPNKAYQLAGVWYAENGRVLTDPEAQQAHRARDKRDAEARRKALLGGAA